LRLPLKPVGLHAPNHSSAESEESYPPTVVTSAKPAASPSSAHHDEEANNIISISPIEATPASDPNVVDVDEPRPSSPINVDEPKKDDGKGNGKVEVTEPTKGDGRPTVNDDGTNKSEEEKGKNGFGKWLKEQIEKMKGWIHGLVDKEGNDEKQGQ